jgi:hypothetical protein
MPCMRQTTGAVLPNQPEPQRRRWDPPLWRSPCDRSQMHEEQITATMRSPGRGDVVAITGTTSGVGRSAEPPIASGVGEHGAPLSTPPTPPLGDQREALFNGGRIGTASEIAVTVQEATALRGILLEIDLECLRVGPVIKKPLRDGRELFAEVGRTWFHYHPLLRKAEVRFSGRGLHLILWLDKPIQLDSEQKRELWRHVIRAVQRALPTDPAAPDVLAMTRPVGAVNTKNGRRVETLREGQPVSEDEILQFCDDLHHRGMATVLKVLFGSESVCPCPKCGDPEQTLAPVASQRSSAREISNRGRCYQCGSVSLVEVIGFVLAGRPKHGVGGDCESGNAFDDISEGRDL